MGWEDQSNKEGGRWLLTLERTQRLRCLDQIWLEIMLFLIGADHNESSTEECINGAVVNIRNKADKVSLWLSISDKSQGHGPQILEAGTELKKRMGIPKNLQFILKLMLMLAHDEDQWRNPNTHY